MAMIDIKGKSIAKSSIKFNTLKFDSLVKSLEMAKEKVSYTRFSS